MIGLSSRATTTLLASVCDADTAYVHTAILPQLDRPAPTGQSRAF